MAEKQFIRSRSPSPLRSRILQTVLSSSKYKSMNTSSSSSRSRRNPNSENTPPIDPNILIHPKALVSSLSFQKSPKILSNRQSLTHQGLAPVSDSSVKVIRPANSDEIEEDQVVKKVSADSIAVGERRLTSDSVLESNLSQEELVKAKSNVYITSKSKYGNSESNKTESKHGNTDGQSLQRSLNLPSLSLSRTLILPHTENEFNEEIESHGELKLQLESSESSDEESDIDLASEKYGSCVDEDEMDEISLGKLQIDQQDESTKISLSHYSHALQDPTLSESPKVGNRNKKSITFPSTHLENHDFVSESSNLDLNSIQRSRRSDLIRSSLQLNKLSSGPIESLAASLQRGLQIIGSQQRVSVSNTPSVAFSFEHLALKPSLTVDKASGSVQTLLEEDSVLNGTSSSLCSSCRQTREISGPTEVKDSLKNWMVTVNDTDGNLIGSAAQVSKNASKELSEAIKREKELQNICQEQAAKIEKLNTMVAEYKEKNSLARSNEQNLERELLRWDDSEHHEQKIPTENCDIREVMKETDRDCKKISDANEKEALLSEIENLKSKLELITNGPSKISRNELRSSLLSKSIHLRKSGAFAKFNSEEELEKERERWMEMESDWISLTEDLRIDLESSRQHAEKVEMELRLQKRDTEELEDALNQSVLGHAKMIEHFTDLQERYNDLVEKHRLTMQEILEIKKAALKAGAKGCGSRFAKSMASELSAMRVERAREMEALKKENKSLRIQVRDTAEAVHAGGELLVRLREAEETASLAEENSIKLQEENEKLREQVDKQKRKHKMEMTTMKQYLAESRLPESALKPLYRGDSFHIADSHNSADHTIDDDEAWRAEFGAIYQDHY